MIIDYPVSSTALAAQEIARDKKRIVIFSSAGAPVLSGKACSPYGFQWMFDTYGLSNGLPEPLAKRGVDSYYFITADYVAGQAVEADFRAALDRAGLKALGGVKYPLGSLDMSSFVVPALSSPAKGLVIAGAGADMTNVMKAAVNFGLKESGKTIVAPATFITDVKGLGLAAAQGLIYVDSFYWDRDDRTRGFAKRFYEKRKAMPTSAQAGVYSGVRHYLKAVDAAKSIDADLVAAKMREMPVEDDAIHSGLIRPDGRVAHDMLLVQVKTPAESQADWDLLKIIAEVPIEKAVKPLADSDCPLVKK
jgi:branched-chain amino acid transport system substrate-binding protein